MYVPIPWVQFLLIFVGNVNREVIKLLFDTEQEIMSQLEADEPGLNQRPLTLFGQLDAETWWGFTYGVCILGKRIQWVRTWLDDRRSRLSIFATLDYKEAWIGFRCSQEWHKLNKHESLYKKKRQARPLQKVNPDLAKFMSAKLKEKAEEDLHQDEFIEVTRLDQIKLETPARDPLDNLSAWFYPFLTPRLVERISAMDGVDYRLWTEGLPIGICAPVSAESWLQMTTCLIQDRDSYLKTLLEEMQVNSTAGLMVIKEKKELGPWLCTAFNIGCDRGTFIWIKKWALTTKYEGATTATLWSQARPFVKCDCFQSNPGCTAGSGLAWLDAVLWRMMNCLDDYFPEEESRLNRLMAFFSLLREIEAYIHQLVIGLRISEWIQASARQVLEDPSRTQLTCMPHGKSRENVEKFILKNQKQQQTPVKSSAFEFSSKAGSNMTTSAGAASKALVTPPSVRSRTKPTRFNPPEDGPSPKKQKTPQQQQQQNSKPKNWNKGRVREKAR